MASAAMELGACGIELASCPDTMLGIMHSRSVVWMFIIGTTGKGRCRWGPEGIRGARS